MTNKKKILLGLVGLIGIILIGVCSFLLIKGDSKEEDKPKKENVEQKETKKEEEEKNNNDLATPLLYKVTKEGSDNTIYLFGSIHAADDRAYPMRKEIMDAFNSSEYLAVEVDTISFQSDMNAMVEAMKPFVIDPTSGKKLKDFMSEEGYNKTIQYMKDNKIYNAVYESYKPSFIYTLLSNVYVEKSGLDATKGIDMYFLNQAHKEKKQVLEYESADFQFKLLSSFSDGLAEAMILASISEEKAQTEGLKVMYDAWLKGDAKALLSSASADEEIPEDDELMKKYGKELDDYNNNLIGNRNEDMVTKTEEFFKDGKNVFVVVGELHVIGEEGLANQLEKAGYTVEQVEYK